MNDYILELLSPIVQLYSVGWQQFEMVPGIFLSHFSVIKEIASGSPYSFPQQWTNRKQGFSQRKSAKNLTYTGISNKVHGN
jgi:hypothetical protein